MSDIAINRLDDIDRPDAPPAKPEFREAAADVLETRLTRRTVATLAIGVGLLLALCAVVAGLAQPGPAARQIDVLLALLAVGIVGLSALTIAQTRRHLRRLTAARTQLRTMVQGLERRVALRTHELTEINQRLDLAVRASGMFVFAQDRDLIYTWLSHGSAKFPVEHVVGRSDADILSPRSRAPVERLKRRVLETGEPAHGEVSIDLDGAARWWELTVVPATPVDGTPGGIVGGAIDISARKQTDERVRLLVAEVTHRAKNLLSVIQAIMRQTAMHSTTLEEFCDRFTGRLNSLAASHDLLVQQDWQGAALHDLVRSQVGHYSDADGSQIEIEGAPLMMPPLSAQHIGMALHELASNAVKYGALSTPQGRVRVAWDVTPDGEGGRVCRLSWSESDGPPVLQPSRGGFGRVVLERTVAHALNGKVDLNYAEDGVRWAITFPLAA
jgi:two-component sensor histidine kinase